MITLVTILQHATEAQHQILVTVIIVILNMIILTITITMVLITKTIMNILNR